MIAIARQMAKSSFGIGVAVGLALCLFLGPIIEARGSVAPPCAEQMNVTPEVQAWINVQCAVRQGAFGDAVDPGTCYRFAKAVSAPGKHDGMTIHNEAVIFDAVYVVQLDLKLGAASLAEQGVEAFMVVGRLAGTAGKVPIIGTVLLPKGITETSNSSAESNAMIRT